MEQNMAWFSQQLQNGKEECWQQAAQKRQEKMNALTWDEKLGAFCDYNFQTRQRSPFLSAAMFYPLFTGLATSEQAGRIRSLLAVLEQEFGVACCQPLDDAQGLQWDYPNGWACLQYIVIHGLLRYGFREDALRLAQKYTNLVDQIFEKTNNLWEKYNVLTGEISSAKEYDTPPMMGWSAGVYLDCLTLLRKHGAE
jgi:alpha,alpha-trehalase